MTCAECKYCFMDFNIVMNWYCCYGGQMHFTPGLIYGDKPEWCPYEKNGERKHEHEDSKPDLD